MRTWQSKPVDITVHDVQPQSNEGKSSFIRKFHM